MGATHFSSMGATYNWEKDRGPQWLQQGEATILLGYPFGLDLTPQQRLQPAIDNFKRQFNHWISKHLSLTCKVLIANQVLLANIIYLVAICHQCGEIYDTQLIWGSTTLDGNRMPELSWKQLTRPKEEGGLGSIDINVQILAIQAEGVRKVLITTQSLGMH